MEILREAFCESTESNGCGCDVFYPGGDCKTVDDGGCGCDD